MLPRCKYVTNSIPIRILVLYVPLVAVLCSFYFFFYASNYSCIHPWFIVSDRKNNQSPYPWTDAKCDWQITPPCPNMISSNLGKSLNFLIISIGRSNLLLPTVGKWLLTYYRRDSTDVVEIIMYSRTEKPLVGDNDRHSQRRRGCCSIQDEKIGNQSRWEIQTSRVSIAA
jgi:hypothetical protein